MNRQDLEKIGHLIATSDVEYGGTLKIKNGKFVIDTLQKGGRYGIKIDKKARYIFHIHTQMSVNENCGYNFPSLADIENAVNDKINKGVELHFVFTPKKTFVIDSHRHSPLKITANLIKFEMDVCDNTRSVSQFIKKFKKEKIFIY